MTRHIHADLIHAWAEGAEIEVKNRYGKWEKTIPSWNEGLEYRLKPKKPEWYENIPEHGILVKSIDSGKVFHLYPRRPFDSNLMTPLTNEEIERFKR